MIRRLAVWAFDPTWRPSTATVAVLLGGLGAVLAGAALLGAMRWWPVDSGAVLKLAAAVGLLAVHWTLSMLRPLPVRSRPAAAVCAPTSLVPGGMAPAPAPGPRGAGATNFRPGGVSPHLTTPGRGNVVQRPPHGGGVCARTAVVSGPSRGRVGHHHRRPGGAPFPPGHTTRPPDVDAARCVHHPAAILTGTP
jgi:hypothetical protein